MLFVEILYVICVVLLSIYGLNSLMLTLIYLYHRNKPVPQPPAPSEWPRVTVQLPIYNELHTAKRLLHAVACLDYPRDRLQIQVLDDSTDETAQLVARRVRRLKLLGIDIAHFTRPDRTGFKAGALAEGLDRATGELVAIFDADFLPSIDFLRRSVPCFGDPAVGCVQGRWGHVNRDYSTFTQTQALGIDGHFVIEQTARSRAGLFLNFNGTAGIWRRACIEDAGGWQHDTLTEDLDLSYRAQLRGWRVMYLPEMIVPAELPAQLSAFKRQQARWAQGSIQTAVKLAGPLLCSSQPGRVKLEGLIHLTGYLVHPLMLAVLLLTFPMSFSHSWMLLGLPWLMVAAAGPPLMYCVAQIVDGGNWQRRLRYLPFLVMLGMGLCLSNTAAVLRAVLGVHKEFQRTPKFDLRQAGQSWISSAYALRADPLTWAELGLAFLAVLLIVMSRTRWTFAPWLMFYAAGFSYVAGISLFQSYRRKRWLARRPK